MFKDLPIKKIIFFGIIGSIIYLVFVGLFLNRKTYDAIWILYIGNGVVAVWIGIFIYSFFKSQTDQAKVGKTSLAGHLVAICGILITCFLVLIASIIFPHWFHSYNSGTSSFTEAPPQMTGSGHSFLFPIFGNAIIGNIAVGSVISIIFPFILRGLEKHNETGNLETDK